MISVHQAHADLRMLAGRLAVIVYRLDADGWSRFVGETRIRPEDATTASERRAADTYRCEYADAVRGFAERFGMEVRQLQAYSADEIAALCERFCESISEAYEKAPGRAAYRDDHPQRFAGIGREATSPAVETWRAAFERVTGRQAPPKPYQAPGGAS